MGVPAGRPRHEQDVELIDVTLPQAEISTTGWYAFLALDESTGDLITWSSYPVFAADGQELTGGPSDH